MKEKAI